MVSELPKSQGNVVGFRIQGKLRDADYEHTVVPGIERAIASGDRARVLLFFDETFVGWEAGAAWDDAKMGLSHLHDFDRLAIVGGPRWVGTGAKLFAPLMKAEVKLFEPGELETAWGWLGDE